MNKNRRDKWKSGILLKGKWMYVCTMYMQVLIRQQCKRWSKIKKTRKIRISIRIFVTIHSLTAMRKKCIYHYLNVNFVLRDCFFVATYAHSCNIHTFFVFANTIHRKIASQSSERFCTILKLCLTASEPISQMENWDNLHWIRTENLTIGCLVLPPK